MSSSSLELKQCFRCSEYLAPEERMCKKCGTVQRVQRREYQTVEEREAKLRKALEERHVPQHLRQAIDLVNDARDHERLNLAVRFVAGLLAFFSLYALLELLNHQAGDFLPLNEAWARTVVAVPCFAGFWLGAKYCFRGFYVVLDALSQVFETEAATHIRKGVIREKQKHAEKRQTPHQAHVPQKVKGKDEDSEIDDIVAVIMKKDH